MKVASIVLFLLARSIGVTSASPCNSSAFEVGVCYKTGHFEEAPAASNASACCAACNQESKCQSWTFHGAPTKSPATCFLKKEKPGSRANDAGCTSGPSASLPPSPSPAPAPAPGPPPGPTPEPPAPASGRPNILFVLTDDQDALLNGYNQSGVAHMHRLNTRVRERGALFTNYYLAYPLCSPSRAAILTGLFPHNHGFVTNALLNKSGFHPTLERTSVAVTLSAAGYHTMLAGKYMNGYHANSPAKAAYYVPPGWGDWFGFQTVAFFGTAVNENGKSVVYPKDNYQTDIIANISLQWLRTTYNRSKPFFMFLTPHAPHAPYTPAPRHKGTLKGLKQPLDPAFNMDKSLQTLLPGNLAHLPPVDAGTMDGIYESRAESLLAIDEMIGHLLDQIEAMGLDNNTYVFFTCDNGYHLGQHRLPPGKREAFQHDINVPLIVSGPGIQPGSTITELVGNYDLPATWAEMAAANVVHGAPVMDGRSFFSLLKQSSATPGDQSLATPGWNRTYTLQEGYQSCEAGHGEGHACSHKLWVSESPGGSGTMVISARDESMADKARDYSALRLLDTNPSAAHVKRNGLYVEYTDGGKTYFDCDADPWQTRNIYSNLTAADAHTLATMLAAVRDCKGSECP